MNFLSRTRYQEFALVPPIISRPDRALVVIWFFAGLVTLLGNIFNFVGSNALHEGPAYAELTFSIIIMFGSASISLSTLTWKQETTNWKLEVLGWPPLIGGWVLFTVLAFSAPPTAVLFGLGFILLCSIRLVEVLIFMSVNRKRWEALQDLQSHA